MPTPHILQPEHRKNILQFLTSALMPGELDTICGIYFENLKNSYWNENAAPIKKAQLLLDFCDKQGQLDTLFEVMEAQNPNKFLQYKPYYQGDVSKQATPTPQAPTYDNPRDQCNLGVSFKKQGRYADAVYWLEKAAQQGDALAQCNLGNCFFYGEGVSADYTQAARWYLQSAQQNNTLALYNLGICYENGYGLPKDSEKAAGCYQKAAQQGDADAQCNLGVCYEKGSGLAQDYTKAVYWYKKSAEQNHAGAQYNLGRCYQAAIGVPPDPIKARYWYSLSAEQHHEMAIKALENI